MTARGESFPFLDVAATALLVTSTYNFDRPENGRYEDVFAYARAVNESARIIARPYYEHATSEDERFDILHDTPELERTIYSGFEDIDTIFYIADVFLKKNEIEETRYEQIMRRSARLAIGIARLDNLSVQAVFERRRYREDLVELWDTDRHSSLSWSKDQLQWIKDNAAAGCPARSFVVAGEGIERQTLIQLMWDRAVTVQFGQLTS